MSGQKFTVQSDSPLLKYLYSIFPGQSKTGVKNVLSKGQVLVNGEQKTAFDFPLHAGDAILVPAEIQQFTLSPEARDTLLMEVSVEPRREPDAYIDPNAEPYLKGEDYDGLEGEELPDPEL